MKVNIEQQKNKIAELEELVEQLNSRIEYQENMLNDNDFRNRICSISFYESIVVININSKKSITTSLIKNNNNDRNNVIDVRVANYFPSISNFINNNLPILHNLPIIKKIVRKIFYTNNFIIKIKNYFKLRKYFK